MSLVVVFTGNCDQNYAQKPEVVSRNVCDETCKDIEPVVVESEITKVQAIKAVLQNGWLSDLFNSTSGEIEYIVSSGPEKYLKEDFTKIVKTNYGFNFVIPNQWLVIKNTGSEFTYRTATDPYLVDQNLSVNSVEKKDDGSIKWLVFYSNGISVYNLGCAPGSCFYLEIDDKAFDVRFKRVESTEPMPENMDGVWAPERNFSHRDLLWTIIAGQIG